MNRKIIYFITVAVLLTATVFYSKNNPKPKNIILMIGDGMGLSQVSESVLNAKNDQFKKFFSIGLVITCSADNLITDSAAGATAYATGFRTKNGRLSIDPDGNILETIVEFAEAKKISTGIVVTCSVTNATPAAFISHNGKRQDEFGIADQIIKSGVDVLLGSGMDFFLPKEFNGKREDKKNLIDSLKMRGYNQIAEPEQLANKLPDKKYFGLFGGYALPHATERKYTLGQLTKSAIKSLSKNKNGFFLMVEGSQIDWAADENDKNYLFGEILDFNSAIEEALKFAEKDKNTLVIVLADHDTGSLGISGKNKDTGELDVVWATKKHTANLIGMFSYGPDSEKFIGIQDNFIVGRKLISYIEPSKIWK